MSDWQVGDLAVCVDNAPREGNPRGAPFPVGSVHSVVGQRLNRLGLPCLLLSGGNGVWRVNRFRKITPDKHEACEDEFSVLLRRSQVSA